MKKERLGKRIASYTKEGALVAFSGGIDSTLVLHLALEASREAGRAEACYVESRLSPAKDLEEVKALAQEYGAKLHILYVDQAEEEAIQMNRRNRCYVCKKSIFTRLEALAQEKGLSYVLDGSNQDDLGVYRPGLQALKDLGIKSPLAEEGMTKKEVRKLAEERGISIAKKPSKPCMATRFPYDTPLLWGEFSRIEAGEAFLEKEGFPIHRIRLYGESTRIEIPLEDFPRFLEKRESLVKGLKDLGFAYVNLDLEGFRSGSMDEGVKDGDEGYRKFGL